MLIVVLQQGILTMLEWLGHVGKSNKYYVRLVILFVIIFLVLLFFFRDPNVWMIKCCIGEEKTVVQWLMWNFLKY